MFHTAYGYTTFLTAVKNDAIIGMDYNEPLPFYEVLKYQFYISRMDFKCWWWSITDEAAYNGNYCLKLENDGVNEGTKHILESKTFDLSDTTKAFLILDMHLQEKTHQIMII